MFSRVKNRIISLAESLFESDSGAYTGQRIALGDVGEDPNWNVVGISDQSYLVGSVWNPVPFGGNPADGPDPAQVDNGTIPLIIQGILDSLGILADNSGAIGQFQIVSFTSGGRIQLSDANGGDRERNPVGVAIESSAGLSEIRVHSLSGSLIPVRFEGNTGSSDVGMPCFLSTTRGLATTIPPVVSGATVYELGIVASTGSDNVAMVLWRPCFRSTNQ